MSPTNRTAWQAGREEPDDALTPGNLLSITSEAHGIKVTLLPEGQGVHVDTTNPEGPTTQQLGAALASAMTEWNEVEKELAGMRRAAAMFEAEATAVQNLEIAARTYNVVSVMQALEELDKVRSETGRAAAPDLNSKVVQ